MFVHLLFCKAGNKETQTIQNWKKTIQKRILIIFYGLNSAALRDLRNSTIMFREVC